MHQESAHIPYVFVVVMAVLTVEIKDRQRCEVLFVDG